MRPPGAQGTDGGEHGHGNDDNRRSHRGGDPPTGPEGAAGAHPPGHRGQDSGGARGVQAEGEWERRVRAAAQAVEHGNGPAQIGQPVDEPPRVVADAVAEGTGDQHHQQEVEGQGPEPHPEGAVGGQEGNEGVGESDGHIAVAHRGDHVEGHEAHAEQREVPVHALGEEPGPALGGPTTEATTPRTTVAVSRTRATSPVERVRYHKAFPPVAATGRRRRRSLGPVRIRPAPAIRPR